MYAFEPTEEQQMLVDAVGRYAASDLRPAAQEAEAQTIFPQKLVNKGWELGLLQASVPESYGGFGDRQSGEEAEFDDPRLLRLGGLQSRQSFVKHQ